MSKSRPAGTEAVVPGRVAVVRARWNDAVTAALALGARESAQAAGAEVEEFEVDGAFELPAAAALLARSGRFAAVVPIGCLVRGETPHFEVLAHAVSAELIALSTRESCAISFGVLTCDTMEQATARAGGSEGNKGAEAMAAALGLVALRRQVEARRGE
ncbi:MAG TPA: 6,7-dimethyl-8-ribityllumazine synthase [Candidatus Limnocylindria bacterium]